MSICIKEPSRVKLRCGGEVDLERQADSVWRAVGVKGGVWWSGSGRWLSDGNPDTPFDIVEVLEPLKPVVIDGPGQYHAIWGGEPCVVCVTGQEGGMWRVRGYPGCVVGTMVHADGSSFLGTAGSRVLAKVQTRQRPLTPDEAFTLLDTWVQGRTGKMPYKLTRVGKHDVQLLHVSSGDYRTVHYADLATAYETEDGSPLSVTEPIPFAG